MDGDKWGEFICTDCEYQFPEVIPDNDLQEPLPCKQCGGMAFVSPRDPIRDEWPDDKQ